MFIKLFLSTIYQTIAIDRSQEPYFFQTSFDKVSFQHKYAPENLCSIAKLKQRLINLSEIKTRHYALIHKNLHFPVKGQKGFRSPRIKAVETLRQIWVQQFSAP